MRLPVRAQGAEKGWACAALAEHYIRKLSYNFREK